MKQRVFRGGRALGLALLCLSALFCDVDGAVNPTDCEFISRLSSHCILLFWVKNLHNSFCFTAWSSNTFRALVWCSVPQTGPGFLYFSCWQFLHHDGMFSRPSQTCTLDVFRKHSRAGLELGGGCR